MVIDCESFLVIFTGWSEIVIIFLAIENNLVYFWGYSSWAWDNDQLLAMSTGWLVIVIVSWAIENNLVNLGLF